MLSNVITCLDGTPNFFGFADTTLAASLLYYAYIPITLISLFIGISVFRHGRNLLHSKLLFLITVLFSVYIINEIILWIALPAGVIYFSWALSMLIMSLIILFLIYFNYVFIKKHDTRFSHKLIFSLFLLPIVFLLPTKLAITSFDITSCAGINGPLWFYFYLISALAALGLLYAALIEYLKKNRIVQNVLMLSSSAAFILFLISSQFIGEVFSVYEINLIGPIGVLLFILALSYLIVKYQTFNIRLLAAQALVFGLIALIGSMFFFSKNTTNQVLIGVTFVLASIGGYFLVRSVKKEVKQKEEIAKLAEHLRVANERLKELDKMKSEFVSIASHQLRSPLTSIRGYASMLAEGSYGKLPQKAQEVFEKIVESAGYMSRSIEDYLNVSRIEAGNMKYELSDFNLKEAAEKLVDELRPVAMKKGLVLVFRSDCNGSCTINADIGKTRQIIQNVIDNSIKYTQGGTITVVAHDDVKKKRMYITIQDTGVGMSKETAESLFEKFVRAKNANNINVTGTGLGLYVAKKMVTSMNGRIWAESEGEGKGSTFHIEFPLLSTKPSPR